jgi:hypothetical protein
MEIILFFSDDSQNTDNSVMDITDTPIRTPKVQYVGRKEMYSAIVQLKVFISASAEFYL